MEDRAARRAREQKHFKKKARKNFKKNHISDEEDYLDKYNKRRFSDYDEEYEEEDFQENKEEENSQG